MYTQTFKDWQRIKKAIAAGGYEACAARDAATGKIPKLSPWPVISQDLENDWVADVERWLSGAGSPADRWYAAIACALSVDKVWPRDWQEVGDGSCRSDDLICFDTVNGWQIRYFSYDNTLIEGHPTRASAIEHFSRLEGRARKE